MRLYENTSGAVIRKKRTMSAPGSAYPDFLVHYGIKGQQWGIRRFQNEDGTLTEEGKARYNEGRPESETWKRSEAEHLTDAELRRRNARLQQEQQYKQLTTSEIEREKAQFKKDLIKKALIIPVVAIAGILGKKYISSHADQIGKVIDKYGKRAFKSIKKAIVKPIVKPISERRVGAQTLNSAVNNAAGRYSGLNRPPIGVRQYRPQTMMEIIRNRRM